MDYPNDYTVTKAPMLAEIAVSYKTKVAPEDRTTVNSSISAANYARHIWGDDGLEYREEMVMLLLNRKCEILGWVKISVGGLSYTTCDQKVVFSIALTANASSFILVHNHPSGSCQPSQQDITLTNTIVANGKLLDLKLQDHIILTTSKYYSFSDEGLLY